MVIVGLIMAALTIYNYFSTPRTEDATTNDEIIGAKVSLEPSLPVFFKKTNWDRAGLYIIIPLGRIPVT
jgi:PAT family beta-lactamase induction signal transducer AmpG